MKADFSRDTFDRSKHYRRVLQQQGRPAIDAEPNEQVAIDAALAETTAYDVIGPSGVPEALLPDGTPAGGFALAAAGNDVTISKGRMYVEGVLVQNDRDGVTFLTQPDALLNGAVAPALMGLGGTGYYAAYLDVFERLIDTVEDPSLREIALGGPDGSMRAKTIWQLKWWPLGSSDAPPTCATLRQPWRRPSGTLTASTGAPNVDPLPCILPPDSGFRRLENQLYRVEVHQGDAYGKLAIKWSRENGSVVAAVGEPAGTAKTIPITGPTFNVTSVGRDATLGFQKGDWVELIDDFAELVVGHGELLEVDSVDPAGMTITTKTMPARAVTPAGHPKLRRWDQRGSGLGGAVIVADGAPIALEDGIQVSFSSDTFRTGDYWTIPARVSLTPGGGTIEWPRDASGTYLPQPPRGVAHHYACLAIFSYDGTTFTFVEDCRKPFPPLTGLNLPPAAPSGPCTLVLTPGPGWEKPLAQLFKDPKAAVDAELCFPVGDFPVQVPVVIQTRGNLKVSGAGWGTKLHGQGVECVLRFEGCASVIVRDLNLASGRVDNPIDGTTREINGTIECVDCDDVDLERLSVECGSGTERGAACITVESTIDATNVATGQGAVRIRGSRLVSGSMQYGILLVHQRRVTVEDNDLTVTPGIRWKLSDVVKQPRYLRALEKMLVSHANVNPGVVAAPSPPKRGARAKTLAAAALAAAAPAASTGVPGGPTRIPPSNASVTVGPHAIAFHTPPLLAPVWQTYFDLNAPKEFASRLDVLQYAKEAARTLLTDPVAQKAFKEFGTIRRYLEGSSTNVGLRGIAVGGQGYTDVRVCNNTIDGFLIGVSVGVSHDEPSAGTPDAGGSVTVAGNQIRVVVNALSRGARHAVFVGNARSINVSGNVADYDIGALAFSYAPASDAIRLYGYFAKRLLVRDNHLRNFTNGVVVHALSAPSTFITQRDDVTIESRAGKVWLVHDNVCENAAVVIDAVACDHADNVH